MTENNEKSSFPIDQKTAHDIERAVQIACGAGIFALVTLLGATWKD